MKPTALARRTATRTLLAPGLVTSLALATGCTRSENDSDDSNPRFGPLAFQTLDTLTKGGKAGPDIVVNGSAVYTISGLCAGLVGALNAAWLLSGVTILGSGMELDAISAVVIGGTLLSGGSGFIIGSLVGVLLPKVIQNVINQIGSLDSASQQVVSGAFLAVVVVAQTWLGRRRRVL